MALALLELRFISMAAPTSRTRLSATLAALLLAAATFLAYAPGLSNRFVWDDEFLVVNNRLIRNSAYLTEVFLTDLAQGRETSVIYYRPLQTVSYLVDYAVWGLNPFGYHLTNLLLHLGCVWLVWRLIEALGVARPWALAGALIFAVHPVNTNAVAYVAGRADMLALAGMLTSLLLWLQYDRTPPAAAARRLLLFLGSTVAFTAALFSRENALLFPALLALVSWWRAPREAGRAWRAARTAAPYLVLAAVYWCWRGAVVAWVLPPVATAVGFPLPLRLSLVLRALATYAGLLLWPAHLQMDRQLDAGGAGLGWLTLAGAAVCMGGVLLAWWTRRRERLVSLGLCWLVIGLLPVSGLFNLSASVAEHWLYLPAIGFYLAAIGLLRRLNPPPAVAIGCLGLAMAALTIRTACRTRDWADAERIFARTAEAAPHSVRARNNLGFALRGAGRLSEARRVLEEAEALNPHDATVQANLAVLYQEQGDWAAALQRNLECLRLDPGNVGAHLRLAEIYAHDGRDDRARQEYRTALALSPGVPPRRLYVGFLLNREQLGEALRVAEETCRMDPANAESFLLLATVLDRLGRKTLAAEALTLAAGLDRHHPEPHVRLGRLAAQRGDPGNAAIHYREAVRRAPDDPLLHYALGEVLGRLGRWHEAENQYQAALKLAPDSARLRQAVAQARCAQGKPPPS